MLNIINIITVEKETGATWNFNTFKGHPLTFTVSDYPTSGRKSDLHLILIS